MVPEVAGEPIKFCSIRWRSPESSSILISRANRSDRPEGAKKRTTHAQNVAIADDCCEYAFMVLVLKLSHHSCKQKVDLL